MLFLNSAAVTEFVRIKVKILHERLAPKKRDKTSLGQSWFSQGTDKFAGVVEIKSLHHAVVP